MFGWLKNQCLEHFLRAAVVLVLALISANTHAAVAVDSVSTVFDNNPTSLSVSHTTAGSDRLMIVGVSLLNQDLETVSSVTYNSTGLNFVGQISQGNHSRVELWSYTNPPAITADVVVTFDEQVQVGAILGVITFTGVDQASPFGSFQSNSGISSTASATVSSAVNEVVLGVMAAELQGNNPAVVVGSPQWTLKSQIGGTRTAGAGATFSGAASVDLTWNLNNSDDWAIGAISIHESSTVGLTCAAFRDEFSSSGYSNQDGTLNWAIDWNEVGDNNNPANGDIQLFSNALLLEGDGTTVTVLLGGPYIEREADLFGYASATLSFDYWETGNWASDDEIEIYVSDDGGTSWNLIQTFTDDQGNSPQPFSYDISAYMASNTRIAFVEKADSNGERFYFDNVQIEVCYLPANQVAYFQMDENAWNGTSDEIVDLSGNDNHGTAVGGASTVNPGYVCRGGDIAFNNTDAAQYGIDTELDVDADIGTTGTISFWYKPDTIWNGGGDRMLVDASTTADNKYFFVTLLNTGVLRFRIEDSADADIQLDTAAKGFVAGAWHHIAITWDLPGDRLEIYIDGMRDVFSTANTTGSWGALGTVYLGDNRSTYHPSGTANSANGVLDEARIYSDVQTTAEIQADMNATHVCVGTTLDHFTITPATTSASTCLANAITIVAEDSSNNPILDYTGLVNISVSTGHGNWSINNADGTLFPDPDTDDNGAVNYTYVDSDDGEAVLDLTNTHAETLTITVNDAVEGVATVSASISYSQNIFVITEDPIQVAGRPQAMTIAMWTDDTLGSGSCGIDPNYNSNSQSLEANIDRSGVLTGAVDPSIGVVSVPDTPATNTIVLDFLAIPGQASFNLDTTDVGQYTLIVADITLVHSGAVITGASSPLTVKPFGLAVTGILAGATPNPGATTPGGTLFTDAGSNFAATVEAVLWDAADDTNDDGVLDTGVYANNIKAPSYAWDTTLSVALAGFEPSTGTAGVLSNGLLLQASFIAGTASPANLAYSEVGSFTLQSLASDYLGLASADLVGDDIIIGRFRPASFTITTTVDGMFANTCTVYTYIGEGFGYDVLHPSFEVSAMNALGVPGVTTNYTGIWAKLDADSVSLTAPTSDQTQVGSDTVTLMALSYTQDAVKFNVTDNADGSFDFEFADDLFVYDKDSNSEITPFDSDIDLLITDVSDTEGVTNSGSFSLTPIAANLRFGRLKLSNVHGSELIDLAMPMVAEYLVSTSVYTLNTDDNCTTIADGHLVITDNLSTPGSSTVTVTNTTAISGDLGVGLTAPGSGGIDGYIDVSPDLSASSDAWLRYDWTGTGSFTEDPTGRATFGIYSGNDVNIYRSQTYQ